MPRTDHRRRNRPPSLARRLRLESLEDRRMLSIVVTNLDAAGPGSLLAAIVQANAEPGPETIEFDAALVGTIELTSGELVITDSLTINGPGPERLTIDANEQSRVFNIDDGTASRLDVEIRGVAITGGRTTGDGGGILSRENLTVTNSNISDNSADGMGGAIFIGPANFIGLAELTIDNSIISGNTAHNGGGIGALSSRPTVTVTNSSISGNTAVRHGGGIFASINDGVVTVTVSNSTISGNTARSGTGGGIYAYSEYGPETVTVTDSTISGNTAGIDGPGWGGGIYTEGRLTVTNSTISGNTAGGGGGGISAGIVTVASSTISGNTANRGGGVHAYDVTVTNSTISGNTADSRGGGISAHIVTVINSTISGNFAEKVGGGIYTGADGDVAVMVTGSILSGNTTTGQVPQDVTIAGASLFAANHSLIGLAAADMVTAGGDNVIDDNPQLAPLADNGGPTQTHALLPGSPAIDAGDPGAVAGEDDVPLFDQRGAPFARVVSGRIDIGAYEFGTSNPADLTGNGFVDFEDLTVLLAAWNQNVSAAEGNLVEADTTPVNFEDLTVLLAAWTGPGAAGAPVGRRLAAAHATSVIEAASFKSDSGLAAPRQAAAYRRANREVFDWLGRATSSRRQNRTPMALRRLQAAASDRATAEHQADETQRRETISGRQIRRGG